MRLSSPRDRPWCGVLRNEVLVFVVALGFEKSTDFTDILKVCLFIEYERVLIGSPHLRTTLSPTPPVAVIVPFTVRPSWFMVTLSVPFS